MTGGWLLALAINLKEERRSFIASARNSPSDLQSGHLN